MTDEEHTSLNEKLDSITLNVDKLTLAVQSHHSMVAERDEWQTKRHEEHVKKFTDIQSVVIGTAAVVGLATRVDRLEQTAQRIDRYGKALWVMAVAVLGLFAQAIARGMGLLP
jgi:hypothetical protein